jgi:DNA-binding MarR family transcriptional regulator
MPPASEFPACIVPADGEASVAEQLATILRRYRKAMSAALTAEDYGPIMPPATWLLLAMAREPGTVGQLARRLGLTKQAVSRLADRLVTLGYCDRRRSETNRRQVLLQATDEGARAAAVLRAGIARADALLLGDLGEGERETFRRTLAVMARGSAEAGSAADDADGWS